MGPWVLFPAAVIWYSFCVMTLCCNCINIVTLYPLWKLGCILSNRKADWWDGNNKYGLLAIGVCTVQQPMCVNVVIPEAGKRMADIGSILNENRFKSKCGFSPELPVNPKQSSDGMY